LALIDGEPNQEDLQIAAKILARYSQGRDERSVDVEGHVWKWIITK
jgi:hypothetical protein